MFFNFYLNDRKCSLQKKKYKDTIYAPTGWYQTYKFKRSIIRRVKARSKLIVKMFKISILKSKNLLQK